ncbi:hypothetical protein CAEBREN_16414 [Caenorhabditis brenneri]|uniref:DUF38 domain-containing protein n=1 Tax=Caenorhabditis brenneri TaxID=135651 RepID=G0NQP8_CAEBE|nr:hypothetical protein CAEBREN_16414 [Caenorhabditis brenneri]
MTEFFKNNPTSLRHCLVYEFLQKKPVEISFSDFCKTVGNDAIKKEDFQFCFNQFEQGRFDDSGKMKLAKTSRSFQTFVENQKLFHRTLKLNISNTRVTIWFNKSVNSEYVRTIDSCVKHHKKRRTFVRGVAYWKQALLDLNSVLKNPKLHLDTLEVVLDTDNKHVFNDLEDASKFDHHLNVENLILRVYSLDKLPNIIPSLKPGYLTSIYIDSHNPNVNLMEKVFEMEQWMQAKYFTLEGFFISPLRNFYHLKEFTVNLNKLSLEDIREIKEVCLECRKFSHRVFQVLFGSSKFEKCSLRVVLDYTYRSICEQEFGYALRENPHIYHYPIPNSTEYFEIEVGGWTLNIQRHKS